MMITQLIEKIIPQNATILIGFSGGPDSIYLLLYLKNIQKQYDLTIIALHLDHQWRPESAQEAQWCMQFCKQLSIQCITEKASNISLSKQYNGSKEEIARAQRRAFFEKEAKKHNKAYIALAHHQDDQVETFFIRLARGASLTGLTGMKPIDGLYLRPLLHMNKQEILDYLHTHDISYLQDPTNQDASFLRNRIRNTLLPCLQEIDQRLPKNILSTMQQFLNIDAFLNNLTKQTIQQITLSTNPLALNSSQFLQLDPVMQQRIILQLLIHAQATFTPSKALLQEIIRFIKTGINQTHEMHSTYKIVKNKNSFSIIKT